MKVEGMGKNSPGVNLWYYYYRIYATLFITW